MFRSSKNKAVATDADLRSLVSEINAGSEKAFCELYDATASRVFGSALRVSGNRADAEKVTCAVYLSLWCNASRYEPARGTPLQWLMCLTRNLSLDYLRRRRCLPDLAADEAPGYFLPAGPDSPEEKPYPKQLVTLLDAQLKKLSAREALVLQLACIDRLTQLEIQKRIDLPLETVKSLIACSLLKLRNGLRNSGTASMSLLRPGSLERWALKAVGHSERSSETRTIGYPCGTASTAPTLPPPRLVKA
jgi:RNA polymerase sigma-70 factor (ECF subfamily)